MNTLLFAYIDFFYNAGEINQSLPAHYKIPTKSAASREKESIKDTTTNAVTKEHEAAAKAFLTQTIGNSGHSLHLLALY